MNIFYLDHLPYNATKHYTKKHTIKMIVEYAQMLSTAHRVLDGVEMTVFNKAGHKRKTWAHPNKDLYKSTHVNHPSTKWVRESYANYSWLCEAAYHLILNYEKESKRRHKTHDLIVWLMKNPPINLPMDIRFTPPPQCMDDKYKVKGNTVRAYRQFYYHEKLYMQPELKESEIYADIHV